MNARVPFCYGAALTMLGAWSWFGTGATGMLALVPLGFGVALQLLAIAVGHKRLRLPALVGVLLVALLGFAGSAGGVPDFIRWLLGGIVERPRAAGVQAAMALFCFGLMGASAEAVLVEWRTQRKRSIKQTRRNSPAKW